jgi:hypothetical protein
VSNLYSALPSLLRLSLGSDPAHPYTTEKVPPPSEAPPALAGARPVAARVRGGAYAFPWPDTVPGFGSRRVVPFELCSACGIGTWIMYGDRPLCLPCARRRHNQPPVGGQTSD